MIVRLVSLACLVVSLSAAPVKADDSNGLYSSFKKHSRSVNGKHSYGVIKNASHFARSGNKVDRFELRDGDCAREDCKFDRERVERTEKGGTKPNEPNWHSWSVYLDPSFSALPKGSTLLGQFKQEPAGNQLVSLEAQKDGIYFILSRLTDAEYAGNKEAQVRRFQIDKRLMSVNAAKGRWIDIVLHSNWAPDETGFLDVFVNEKRIASYRGKITYNDRDKVTFRYGIYRGRISENRKTTGTLPTQVVYFDNVKRGRTRDDLK